VAKRKVVRTGIIAYGRSGRNIHTDHLKTNRNFKIVAVTEVLAARRRDAAEELGVDVYDDYRKMLKRDDLDLVINTTPSHLHVPVTLDVLRKGFDCLCEKPLARKASDVDRLIAASKKAKKMLAIYQQSRFAAYFTQVRKVIDSGVLGRVVMVKIAFNGHSRRWDWQTVQEYNGGNLLNTGPHPMDQALVLFGKGMPEVKCVMDRCSTFGDAEDHVKVLLTGKGNPTIDLEVSSCCGYSPYVYQVYGTQGGLTATMDEMKWRYYNPKRAPKQKLIRTPLPGQAYCREKLPWVEKTWAVSKAQADLFGSTAKQFYKHLYKTLADGAPLVITPEQVRRQIAVIEECHRQNPLSRRKK
jgi:predicted dehydrogenase